MQSVETVLRVIGEKVEAVGAEEVALDEAFGRVLAEHVIMDMDSPPFDRAVVDGFAVRSEDAVAGAVLRVVGHQNAGDAGMGGGHGAEAGAGEFLAGTCVGVNTGAPVPAGADGVIMVEQTEAVVGKAGFIQVKKGVGEGQGIQRQGSDAGEGARVLDSGTRLSAAALAVAATAGRDRLAIRRLRAAVLTTGDELVPPGQKPGPGQIRNSNRPMLGALLREFAAVWPQDGSLLDLGSAGDRVEVLRPLLERGLSEADLLVVTGGMSMGTRDLVPPLLRELGVEFLVEKVRMKPGKPFVLGVRRSGGRTAYVAGLPGNPVSAFVTFHRFVRPMIGRMLGEIAADRAVEAEVSRDLAANGEREFYLPCRLRERAARLVAEPMVWQGSADVFMVARAQGLIIRPAGAEAVRGGAVVPVLPLMPASVLQNAFPPDKLIV